ncbi:MAG: putative sulfate exporter family transporter, partial [Pseudomonadota bacterium]
IGPLIYLGNPAVALLAGGTIALALNRTPVPQASVISKYCLQTAIVLLGLKLNLETVWTLSATYTWGVAAFVLGTLAVGAVLGWLIRAERIPTALIVSGTAICGGTTIATLSPVIGARPHETAVTLSLVFLLNVVALFSFPLIGKALDLSQLEFGLWSALAIHDTSSVVATAAIYGEEAAEVATTIKLGRTLWLIPLVLAASFFMTGPGQEGSPKVRIPGFILAFLGATAVGTFLDLPGLLTSGAGMISKALLVIALFLVGCELTRSTLRQIRGRTFWLGIGLWLAVAPLVLVAVLKLH